MGDFKIGTTRPSVGNIHLGSKNVYEIYRGANKVWPYCADTVPAEVTIPSTSQIWENKNSVVTAKTNGGNISIVTNATDWVNAVSSNTPAACYWGFNSANAEYGLFYNKHCLSVIQPPTGFRLPTGLDAQVLVNRGPSGTELSNNDCGLWPPDVNANPDLGNTAYNQRGRGVLFTNSLNEVTFRGSIGSGSGGYNQTFIWHTSQPVFPSTGIACLRFEYEGSVTPAIIETGLPTFVGANAHGFNIRFVKDVPNSGIYGAFLGSPDDTQSGTPNIYTQTVQSGFNSNRSETRVATSLIVTPTFNEFRFKAKVNAGNFTMNSVQILAYADSARTIHRASFPQWNGPVAMTSSYQDPWGPLTFQNSNQGGIFFMKVIFDLSVTGSGNQQGYQITLT